MANLETSNLGSYHVYRLTHHKAAKGPLENQGNQPKGLTCKKAPRDSADAAHVKHGTGQWCNQESSDHMKMGKYVARTHGNVEPSLLEHRLVTDRRLVLWI